MLKKTLAVLLVTVLSIGLIFAADTSASEDRVPETLAEKFSYALGILCASNYGTDYAMMYFSYYQYYNFPEIDEYFGALGMYDLINGTLLYSYDELNGFLSEYPEEYEARLQKLAADNLKAAEDFLEQNKKKSGIQTTASGLQYQVIKKGNGALAKATDSVELDYELKLLDGTVIDSSYARGEHSTFPMDSVIEGFKEGVMLMPMGSHYIFYIHPDLGYGAQQTGSMGPNSLLIFEVETYSIADQQ
ncbi:MAG: FKBP-type peptidyl-prolyl cis-trans isomerase [Spirochaetales bacterium]|nr:FKBP-type peptidyl-prolyl cis-trans isomerase [Spirochaetales bacterium]